MALLTYRIDSELVPSEVVILAERLQNAIHSATDWDGAQVTIPGDLNQPVTFDVQVEEIGGE